LFRLRTTARLAIQLFSIFEYFYGKRLINRDTKSENFLLGLTDTDNYNVVHLIDFGLRKQYKDTKGRHIPNGDARLRYVSFDNHIAKEQSFFQRDIIFVTFI
jgi:serine/threonine protein kinase